MLKRLIILNVVKQTAEDISTESEFIPQIDILFDEKEIY